jgi:hypothetical protein
MLSRTSNIIYKLTCLLLCTCLIAGCSKPINNTDSNQTQKSNQEIKLGAHSGNISNGGLVGGGDGWVYYRSEADHWRLYKARHDGSERQKLCDDIPSNINVINGYVYYSNYGYGDCLFRIRTDGTEREQITEHRATSVTVVGDTIYYISYGDDGLHLPYKVKVDGTGHALIAEIVASSMVTDGRYLYITHKPSAQDTFSLYRMNLDGSNLVRLNNVYSHYPILIGNQIYYWNVDDGRLFQMGKDGLNNKAVTNARVDVINGNGSFLFYQDAADNYNVYRIRLDGSDKKKITEFPTVLKENEPNHYPSNAFLIDGYYYYRAFHSPEIGDAIMQVKPEGGPPVVWDAQG